jgi:hypothetical protein
LLFHKFDLYRYAPEFRTELEEDVEAEAKKFGEVDKVKVFTTNPDGAVSVRFKTAEAADKCVAAMDGRWFGGQQLEAAMWDGQGCVALCATPIGQPCMCEPMPWLYFVFVQSLFVFVWFTLAAGSRTTPRWARARGRRRRSRRRGWSVSGRNWRRKRRGKEEAEEEEEEEGAGEKGAGVTRWWRDIHFEYITHLS